MGARMSLDPALLISFTAALEMWPRLLYTDGM
jgi:hypothetical protein